MLYHELQSRPKSPAYEELDRVQAAEMKGIIDKAMQALPEHRTFFANVRRDTIWTGTTWSVTEAISILEYIMKLENLQRKVDTERQSGKIFATAEEKIKEAALSFSRDDYGSVINNLNTALELALKDKLGIPSTITKIRTGRIIDIMIANKVGPYRYLAEAQKHVLLLDNKVKHQGYQPSKTECISALKSTEDLVFKLRSHRMKLPKEVQDTVYESM